MLFLETNIQSQISKKQVAGYLFFRTRSAIGYPMLDRKNLRLGIGGGVDAC
jgi:hypothetical protein